jgi:acetyltransferase-like isoleucine patch superfamily enzyme
MKITFKTLREMSIFKTLFWNLRCRNFTFPLIICPETHFRMGANAGIVPGAGGRLTFSRWPLDRFKQSQLKIAASGKLEINGNFRIYSGFFIDICEGATLSLGSGYINNNVRIVAFDKITMGSDVAISENVTIWDSDSHSISGASGPVTSPVCIGDGVWIGMNVTILRGVRIGDGAVVAANSLVREDVPPRTLVGGVPARVIRENVSWR